jgi:hypothetical protein
MSFMIAPPRPERPAVTEAQVLFAEARRRRRRRWLAGGAVVLLLLGGVAGVLRAGLSQHRPAAAHPRPRGAPVGRTAQFTLPPAQLAWVDYNGQLHVGDVAGRTQRVVAAVPSAAGGWLVSADGHLYWPDFTRNVAPIRDYSIATGKIRYLARGQSVFVSADGRQVFIVQSGTRLIELRTVGSGVPRRLTTPAGWQLDDTSRAGLADGGIILSASQNGPRAAVAVWYPGTGRLKVIGTGAVVMGSDTSPGGRQSLIAWTPRSCTLRDCPVEITNPSTLATVTVRSPLRHGFTDVGAAFSPGGTRLALFARRASISSAQANQSELAIADTRTGALRLIGAARLETQEDSGWIVWLPGGQRLLAGALLYSYAADAQTLAARPFFFFPSQSTHDIMNSPDVNFSAVLITGRAAPSLRAPLRSLPGLARPALGLTADPPGRLLG